MLQLSNGCHCSQPSIYPANWDKTGACLSVDWKIQFYFYDPLFKDKYSRAGKYCQLKGGINRLKTLTERRIAAKVMLQETIRMLTEDGFNPITGKSTTPAEQPEYEIHPSTPIDKAMHAAAGKLVVTPHCKEDIKSVLGFTHTAIAQLRLNTLEIQNVKRRHIKMLLEHLGATKKKWSAHTFNKYRSYLMIIFKYLIECEATEINPVREISKQKTVRKIRVELTTDERIKVDEHLRKKTPSFHRFVHIFFHSGGRLTELMQLRACDVDLENQTYKSVIKKGRSQDEVKRTIKNIALPLWKDLLKDAKPEDYIFSKGLVPGGKPIRTEQITRRWFVHVKQPIKKGGLNIKADFYSLKHSNLDEITNSSSMEDAAAQAGHKSTAMVKQFYAQGENKRQHERLKNMGNSFA